MGTVNWVFSWSNKLQRTVKIISDSETTHAVQEPQICSRDLLYILELSGYIVVLGVFQYLWQTSDDVTLNLHWCHWHQLHELRCQLLQITGRTEGRNKQAHCHLEIMADVKKKYMITGLMERISKNKNTSNNFNGYCTTRPIITEITTLLSTTLSSHLSWLIIMRGILRPPSPVLWRTEQDDI